MSRPSPADAHHARAAYDAFAEHYDLFTADHDYDAWTSTLEALAVDHGLRGRRLLDVACGTGKSFLPMLRRGYEVAGCDISQEMLRIADEKARGRARLESCDMRHLPTLGQFDLVFCLDDAMNYLLTPDELGAAMDGLCRNLAPHGVGVFDVNTLASYRTFFGSRCVVSGDDRVVIWEGQAAPTFARAEIAQATVEILVRESDAQWARSCAAHYQRHHPRSVIEAAIEPAGLRLAGVYGMYLDGSVSAGFDEHENSKAVYVVRRAAPPQSRVQRARAPEGEGR
jgi:SAM-dependent methyltransferase